MVDSDGIESRELDHMLIGVRVRVRVELGRRFASTHDVSVMSSNNLTTG